MALEILNINGDDWVNVNALIEDFVEVRGQDAGEYSYYDIHDPDDDVIDGLINYLFNKDKKDIAMKLKSAWIKKRYGSFFHE